jgi:hypothetical protein
LSEIIEFEQVYSYSLFEEGITLKTILQYGGNTTILDAKVDTGSTYCVFEGGIGEALEIDVESGIFVSLGTATGNFPTYGHELTLTVLDIETVSTVYFAENPTFNKNVLGRIGWLDRVKLGLIEQEGKLYLSEYGK